jgi:hypothetical protein
MRRKRLGLNSARRVVQCSLIYLIGLYDPLHLGNVSGIPDWNGVGGNHLEEPLQPPHLEDALSDQNTELEYRPPLDSCIGALGGVSMGALPDDNVCLLVFDLGQHF